MDKEKFISLLSKRFAGKISSNDRVLLDQAIISSEEYNRLASELESYLTNQNPIELGTAQLQQIWTKINLADKNGFNGKYNYESPKRSNRKMLLLRIAAVFVLGIGTVLLGYRLLNHSDKNQYLTVSASDEKIFKLLDDGTKVWLNKKSSVRLNTAFGKNKREIFLNGEAYFDVAKNKSVPLIVHVGNVNIEVKGTAFNVNAYRQDSELQVALLHGLIQVTDQLDTNYKILLKPNEKLTYKFGLNKQKNNFLVEKFPPVQLRKDTNWTADTLVFRKEKLKDLALKLEKKYDLKIEIQSEKLKEKRFSGTLTNESIQQALAALKLSYPLTYTIDNRLVVIKD